jgi:hypothetical protein
MVSITHENYLNVYNIVLLGSKFFLNYSLNVTLISYILGLT